MVSKLPGYPARIHPAADGGAWLALFAPRNRLIEFILLEDEHGFINVVVPRQLVEPNAEVVKFAPFILVRGRLEREGKVINVVGRDFLALEAAAVVHTTRDFR